MEKFGRRSGTGTGNGLELCEYVGTFGLCQSADKRKDYTNLVKKNRVRQTFRESGQLCHLVRMKSERVWERILEGRVAVRAWKESGCGGAAEGRDPATVQARE